MQISFITQSAKNSFYIICAGHCFKPVMGFLGIGWTKTLILFYFHDFEISLMEKQQSSTVAAQRFLGID
jgi:hypothetical protein